MPRLALKPAFKPAFKRAFKPAWTLAACLVVTLLAVAPAPAQSPSPEAIAAAKQLMVTMKSADQFKAIMPSLFHALKPVIVQNRADVDRDYDALVPVLMEAMNARVDQLLDRIAALYAQNFTVDELHEIDAFYRGPTGQKFVARMPGLMQQSVAIGGEFGRTLGVELQQRMKEELRKRGHDL